MSTVPTALFARNQSDLNRFYTRRSVGQLLAERLGDVDPISVLDLGAGQGSLSTAVAARWPHACFVTVDLDSSCIDNLLRSFASSGSIKQFHHIHDALDPDLPRHLKHYGEFDLAVCNPPFYRPTWTRDFARILQSAGLEDACPSVADVTAEILFLAQNLRVVRNEGLVALIAPDNLLTGWRTAAFRKCLSANHRIEWVMQLPNHSFHDTEARCFILVLRKNATPVDFIKLLRCDSDGTVSDPLFVDRISAEQRLDYDFHVLKQWNGPEISTLRQIGADIRRGSVNSTEARRIGLPTFHTSHFKNRQAGEISFDHPVPPNSGRLVVAEKGDILMARIDRSLHEKVGLVTRGEAVVTDCVYRVRVSPQHQQQVVQALRSPEGVRLLKATSKGVGARLLGKADLLDLPLPLGNSAVVY